MTQPFRGSASEHTRGRLAGPRFDHLSRDLYVVAGPEPSRFADLDVETRVEAALTVFPGETLGHVTSLLLTKVTVNDDGLVHLMRAPGSSRSERDGIEVHRTRVRDDEFLRVKGRTVTAGPRALADVADCFDLEGLVAIGDQLAKRYAPAAFEIALSRAARRPGVQLLREAIPLLDKGSASPAETRARLRLHAAGFTALEHKVVITDDAGQWLAEADLGDPLARVALQHDGLIHFTKGVPQRINDVARDDLSRSVDWHVVNSTVKDDRDPDLLIRKVTAAYFQSAQLRGPHVLPDFLVEPFHRHPRRRAG